MRIGICDDSPEIRQQIKSMCVAYCEENGMEHEIVLFESGEEVLEYIEKKTPIIDALFLDIEMPGINGIQLMDVLLDCDKVWRIIYVSGYVNRMPDAYSIKTIGFIPKPFSYDIITNKLNTVVNEKKKNTIISIRDIHSKPLNINIEDIVLIKADGSYTYIYTKQILSQGKSAFISSKTLGDMEKETRGSRLTRVHKSFMINPDYLKTFAKMVELTCYSEPIPVGRSYREIAKRKILEYGKSTIQGRL